jgi:hypothetical protein
MADPKQQIKVIQCSVCGALFNKQGPCTDPDCSGHGVIVVIDVVTADDIEKRSGTKFLDPPSFK